MIHRQYNVTGHMIDASFSEKEVTDIFIPLLEKLVKLKLDKKDRVIVYLAAPPGAGKTTLSLFLEDLYKEQDHLFSFQSVAMDGFHHYNAYLESHTVTRKGHEERLKDFKGIPESFDLNTLKEKIEALRQEESIEWPTYDRTRHDVSEETVEVDTDIVLIEGNYLLLDKEGWRELKEYADYTIFIDTTLDRLEKRLIDRKQLGGTSLEKAVDHYNKTDKVNAELVLAQSMNADLKLYLTSEGFSRSAEKGSE